MSPERTQSQLSASKPYVRKLLSNPLLSSGGTPSSPGLPDHHALPIERPGFPTYAQYKQIESNYIESLTPRRQGKALISQSMFDRIWDVLHHPESQIETAQFRFWARKMFTVCKDYRITLGVPEGMEAPAQEVLLHDNLLVAIQEQLYDLLCYCHGSTGHGGRDKTCALIRKHYTWVPKDLVSNFIKACPTCIMKKCGNVDVNSSHIPQLMVEADRISARFISQHDSVDSMGSGSSHGHRHGAPGHLRSGHPHSRHDLIMDSPFGKVSPQISLGADSSNPMLQPLLHQPLPHLASPASLSWTSTTTSFGSYHSPHISHNMYHNSHSATDDHSTRSSFATRHSASSASSGDENSTPFPMHPMVREVSLYKGLPNGWQYHHDDFETAHSEFMMEYKRSWGEVGSDIVPDEGSADQRSIPGIAGFWTPEQFRGSEDVKEEVEDDLDMLYSNAMLDARGQLRASQFKQFQNQDLVLPPMSRALDVSDQNLPPILRGMGTPHLSHEWNGIDPALIALSGSGSLPMLNTAMEPDHTGLADSLSPSSTSGFLNRSSVPPSLHLDLGNTAEAFQRLVASEASNGTSWQGLAASTGNGGPAAGKSPTSSIESYSSAEGKQSPIFDTAEATTGTPDSSTTTTPVDEPGQTKSELTRTIVAVTQALVDHQAQQVTAIGGVLASDSFNSIGSIESLPVGQAVGA
ncbi:hypothetical protein BKA70DRAFT_1296744 [Coprinopsis sp. MPI-PUGE-AT-0042]|nr:hypothetical protein BKA70DRAFT_1296744 [Coprinopsis sp. MPI-PUGE-AT-0042]